MNFFLSKVSEEEIKIRNLKRTCKLNNLSPSLLEGLSKIRMKEISIQVLKQYKQNPLKAHTFWFQCEIKLFIWVLVVYSSIYETKIQNFGNEDWRVFEQIFVTKDIYTFKYESKRLLKQNENKSRSWSFQEDQILIQIMEDKSLGNKWGEVSRRFYHSSEERYFRTGKQCREQWINHLDPSRIHGKWCKDQDDIIIQFVHKYGKKWSVISNKQLSHRTQHMIKNRYKSLVSKFRKDVAGEDINSEVVLQAMLQKLDGKEKGNSLRKSRIERAQTVEKECMSVQQAQKWKHIKIQQSVPVNQNLNAVSGVNQVLKVNQQNQKVEEVKSPSDRNKVTCDKERQLNPFILTGFYPLAFCPFNSFYFPPYNVFQ